MSKKSSEKVGLLSVNSINDAGVPSTSRFSSHVAYDSFSQHQIYQQNLKEMAEDQMVDTFLRKTMKFWVLPSNFVAVKRRILRHIPEWRYDGKVSPSLEESGCFCESIYWDTDSLALYNKRILQIDESMLFRYRWYSNKLCKHGFMEQKIRKPAWRGEASIKQRFNIDPKLVRLFLKNGPNVIPKKDHAPFIDEMFQLSPKMR